MKINLPSSYSIAICYGVFLDAEIVLDNILASLLVLEFISTILLLRLRDIEEVGDDVIARDPNTLRDVSRDISRNLERKWLQEHIGQQLQVSLW